MSKVMNSEPASALLVIDVQNDFCTGGALAVPESERVVAALNQHIEHARSHMPVYASRDWHPARTTHFKDFGGQWPRHCVRDSHGAQFHADLRLPPNAIVITKGEQEDAPGYSAFDGRTPDGAMLHTHLQQHGVKRLYVGGLATDYCVRSTVLDALRRGFDVTVLDDAIAGVDLKPGDADRARDEMRASGARFAHDLRSAASL